MCTELLWGARLLLMTSAPALTHDLKPDIDLPLGQVGPGAPLTIGLVSYLNTLPLISGLEKIENVRLAPTVPAEQVGLLETGQVDLALCSVVDLVRSPVPLCVVPVGMLGCQGPTLTVRLFSRRPLEQLRTVYCDSDSHTSVRLIRVLFRELHGVELETPVFNPRQDFDVSQADAFLLIGDKVMNNTLPLEFQTHQMDLGEAWFQLTGLPFVFATWMCRADLSDDQAQRVQRAAVLLDRTRRRNAHRLNQLAVREGRRFKWDSASMARVYLEELLRFEFTPQAEQAMTRFLEFSEGFSGSLPLFDWKR